MAICRWLGTPGQDIWVCWHWPRRFRRRENLFRALHCEDMEHLWMHEAPFFLPAHPTLAETASLPCLLLIELCIAYWVFSSDQLKSETNCKAGFSLLLILLGTGRDTEYTGSGQPPGTDQLLGSDGHNLRLLTTLTAQSRVSVLEK